LRLLAEVVRHSHRDDSARVVQPVVHDDTVPARAGRAKRRAERAKPLPLAEGACYAAAIRDQLPAPPNVTPFTSLAARTLTLTPRTP